MAHTNIISRKLDIDCINFGFSGNGRMEQPIAELISEIDPLFYIIECMPNMFPANNVTNNTIPLVDKIREKNSNKKGKNIKEKIVTLADFRKKND